MVDIGGLEKDRLLIVESVAVSDLLGGLVRLLGQEDSLDVGQDSTLGDGDSGKQLVQLLVVPDGQLEMTGDDPGLLVVTGSVASQLEDLSGEVLHDGGQIDGGSGTNTGGVVTLPQETVYMAHGELESSAAGAGLGLGLGLSSLYRTTEEMNYNASSPRNETGQDSNVKQDDVSNTPQLYPDPAADPAPTCTEPFSNFSDYLSNLSN